MPLPQMPPMTRRIFLNRTLQALGAAAAAPIVAKMALASGTPEKVSQPFAVLSEEEYHILQAIADTMIPPGGAFDLGASDVDLARRIDAYMPKIDGNVVTGIRGAMAFVEQKAPGLAGKEGTFSALSRDDRAAVFKGMISAGGLAAGAFLGLKWICLTYFYTMDKVWPSVGYDGPMLLEDRS